MKIKIKQNIFNKTLNKNRENIDVILEGKKNISSKYNIILKSYEMNKKIFQEFGFKKRIIDPKGVTVSKTKQPTLRELVIEISKDVKTLKADVKTLKTDIKLIKSLPTIKAELLGEEHVPKWAQKLIDEVLVLVSKTIK